MSPGSQVLWRQAKMDHSRREADLLSRVNSSIQFQNLAVMREIPNELAVGDEDVEVTFHRHRTSVAISC